MILHIFRPKPKPDPLKAAQAARAIRIAAARAVFERAQAEYDAAEARQDTRKMGEKAAQLRAANRALLNAELGR